MSSMNFNCDSCGREVFGCTFVNGMKFCAKCYQETFGETDKDRKIADLEAKLVEKDKEIAYMTKQAKKFNNEAQKYYEDAYCNDFQKQTKIDFAVEQLKKVKKDIDCYMAIREGDLPSNIECLLLDFADKIDNQINGLKGEK